jgi:MbtH protein
VKENSMSYKVVVNQEGQFSILPIGIENIPGWKDVDKRGSKEECLAYIKRIWIDMKPISVQKSTR